MGYKIVSNVDMSIPSPAGGFEAGREIVFVTDDGHRGKVRVAMRQFTPEHVGEAIDAQIASIDAVNKLGQ